MCETISWKYSFWISSHCFYSESVHHKVRQIHCLVPAGNHEMTTGPMDINAWFPVLQIIYLDSSCSNTQITKGNRKRSVSDRALLRCAAYTHLYSFIKYWPLPRTLVKVFLISTGYLPWIFVWWRLVKWGLFIYPKYMRSFRKLRLCQQSHNGIRPIFAPKSLNSTRHP